MSKKEVKEEAVSSRTSHDSVVWRGKEHIFVSYRNLLVRYLLRIPQVETDRWIVKQRKLTDHDMMVQLNALINSALNEPIAQHVERLVPNDMRTVVCLHTKNGNKDFSDEKDSNNVMMSSTNAEIRDMHPLVSKVHETYMINGLGLGIVPFILGELPETKFIRAHEINPEIIAIIEPNLRDCMRKGVELEIVEHDAFGGPIDSRLFDCIWHDIWPTITSENIPQFKKLRAIYGHISQHQYCWAEEYCLMIEARIEQFKNLMKFRIGEYA